MQRKKQLLGFMDIFLELLIFRTKHKYYFFTSWYLRICENRTPLHKNTQMDLIYIYNLLSQWKKGMEKRREKQIRKPRKIRRPRKCNGQNN